MLALFTNWGPTELFVVFVVAVLVFGRRLPEVAGQAAHKVGQLRRQLETLRRESGIDQEIREVQRTIREGMDPALSPRQVARKAAQRALETSGLDPATRAEVAAADPLRAMRELREDVPPAGYSEEGSSSLDASPESSDASSAEATGAGTDREEMSGSSKDAPSSGEPEAGPSSETTSSP